MKKMFYKLADAYLSDAIKVGDNFDAVRKVISYKNKKGILYLLTTLTSASECAVIAESLLLSKSFKKKEEQLYNAAISTENDYLNLKRLVLSGVAVLLLEENDYALTIEVRKYPTRGISEPKSEKSVRGSKDGFTESINDNIGLLRRRVRDDKLSIYLTNVGNKSKTDIAICSLDDKVDTKILDCIKEKLKNLELESLVMTSKAIVEKLLPQHLKPFPLVRYSERPDIAAINLYQGKIIIFVDTSPDVIILPISYFDHLDNVEDEI